MRAARTDAQLRPVPAAAAAAPFWRAPSRPQPWRHVPWQRGLWWRGLWPLRPPVLAPWRPPPLQPCWRCSPLLPWLQHAPPPRLHLRPGLQHVRRFGFRHPLLVRRQHSPGRQPTLPAPSTMLMRRLPGPWRRPWRRLPRTRLWTLRHQRPCPHLGWRKHHHPGWKRRRHRGWQTLRHLGWRRRHLHVRLQHPCRPAARKQRRNRGLQNMAVG